MRILTYAFLLLIPLAGAAIAPALAESGTLEQFQGVWIDSSAIAQRRQQGSGPTARNFDLAFRQTRNGFDLTWQSLSHEGQKRIRAQFVAANERDTFTALDVDPSLARNEMLWAKTEEDRLVLYLSSLDNNQRERIARYEFSVSNGRMSFKYTLSHGDLVLESLEGRLFKAKVVL